MAIADAGLQRESREYAHARARVATVTDARGARPHRPEAAPRGLRRAEAILGSRRPRGRDQPGAVTGDRTRALQRWGLVRRGVRLGLVAVLRLNRRVGILGRGRQLVRHLGGCVGLLLHDERHRAHDVLVAQVHQPDALRGAAVARDALDARALHHSVLRDEDEVEVLADDQSAGETALLLGQLDRLHAHRAAALARVVGDRGALAVAVVGHDEELGVVPRDV